MGQREDIAVSFSGVELLLKTQEVTAYLHKLCHLLDDFEFGAFVEEFTDDGSYRLIPRNNFERGYRIHIIHDDKNRLRYRRDLILKQWHHESFRANRMLSNILVSFPTKEKAESVSNFAMYHTNAEGSCSLHLVGKFNDTFIFDGNRWRIQHRLAILDNFLPDEGIVLPP